MTRGIQLLASAVAFSFLGFSDADAQSGRKGVENAVKRMVNAANRVNLDAVLAEFAPNAEMLDNGVRYANAAAVRSTYAPVFKGLRKQDIKIERSNIQMITPTLAVYTGSGTFTATDTLGVTSPRRGFAWTMIWRADSTNWKATSVHQSLAAPPAATVTQAGRPSDDDTKAFRAIVAEHAATINNRDGAARAATFTANGDEILVDGPRVVGRDAIRASSTKELKAWPASRRFTLNMTGARIIAPNVALIETEATFSEGPVRANRGTMVVVREGGKWLISSLRVYPATARR